MGVVLLRAFGERSVWDLGRCPACSGSCSCSLGSARLPRERESAWDHAQLAGCGWGPVVVQASCASGSEFHSEVSSWLSCDKAHILGEACLNPASGSHLVGEKGLSADPRPTSRQGLSGGRDSVLCHHVPYPGPGPRGTLRTNVHRQGPHDG